MNESELIIEEINPCGGSAHARKTILEVEADSPESYVKEDGRFPILETVENADGSLLIITGDGAGYFIRYTFSE